MRSVSATPVEMELLTQANNVTIAIQFLETAARVLAGLNAETESRLLLLKSVMTGIQFLMMDVLYAKLTQVLLARKIPLLYVLQYVETDSKKEQKPVMTTTLFLTMAVHRPAK